MNITESKQVNLSSSSATIKNGSKNSSMVFNLNSILKMEKNILYNLVSVVHAQIPCSYCTINDSNNYLSLSVGNYTFQKGNYNANSFITLFKNTLPVGFNLVLNNVTGIFTMSCTSNFTINSNSTCYKIMGFEKTTSYSSSSNSLIFPYPCNFYGINRIKIKSSIIQTSNLDTYSKGKSNMLVSIPVNSAMSGLITFSNLVGFKSLFHNQNLDYIDIQLTDEYDNEINFNGIDVFICLQFDTIRSDLPQDNNLHALLEKNAN